MRQTSLPVFVGRRKFVLAIEAEYVENKLLIGVVTEIVTGEI
jgi:hypothetical protein